MHSTFNNRHVRGPSFMALIGLLAIVAMLSSDLWAQGYAPAEAVKHMTVADGLKVTLFASEPQVRQAIFVKCDTRGRVWTIQYLQYPNPAGLQRVAVDRWSRTVYDRLPEPPPRGPRGADRITILTDHDGDGHADEAKDFVDGLNLVTGVEFGYGGVFVLNPPYLLFYPDANHDDAPDADPQVLLTGFGMEDAQAMSSHLTWGPDGWLYGVNGSTTTCRIRGSEFQQGVWRYHPVTHAFELFCEGGSNCYGLTFDANGELFYSTNGGPFVHAIQGGYYYKSFGKHGPLHNLFAYHYFPELERDQVPGGPPTGGTVYSANAFPERLQHTFMAGNFLGHTVSWWQVEPAGSTVRATYGGVVLDTHDTWCGPTDLCLGPEGSLYVSDFFDQRTAHPDPDAHWDRSNGRIYKVSASDTQRSAANRDASITRDIRCLSSSELVRLLAQPNRWYAYRARAELAARRDDSVVEPLRTLVRSSDDSQLALESLWTLHAMAKLDDKLALELLDHRFEYVRFWAVRFIGDENSASPPVIDRLVYLAANEPSPVVRAQLAASARRLPAAQGFRIVIALLNRIPVETDARIPWLIWWAIESKALSDAELVTQTFGADSMWQNVAARENNLRLIRRFAAEGTATGYDACARMLASAPGNDRPAAEESLRLGLSERAAGLQTIGQGGFLNDQAAAADDAKIMPRSFEPIAGSLQSYIQGLCSTKPVGVLPIEVALRANLSQSMPALRNAVFGDDRSLSESQHIELLALLGEFGQAEDVPRLVAVLRRAHSETIQRAALDAIASLGAEEVGPALLADYPSLSPMLRQRLRALFLERPASAMLLLQAVDDGRISSEDVQTTELRRLALLKSPQIDARIRERWGSVGPGSPEEKLATIRRFNNDLRAGSGDRLAGKIVFQKTCGVCHRLNGEGNQIGPDLTTANRADRMALLANVVDPSAVIRKEFLNYIAVTTSGRVLNGVIAEQDGTSITLVDANNQRTKIPRGEIDELNVAESSLMPEKLLEPLTPQQLRDLFAYLQDQSLPQKDK